MYFSDFVVIRPLGKALNTPKDQPQMHILKSYSPLLKQRIKTEIDGILLVNYHFKKRICLSYITKIISSFGKSIKVFEVS